MSDEAWKGERECLEKLIYEYLQIDDPEYSYVPVKKNFNKLYFIREGKKGNIKIGISKNPTDRLSALQTGTSKRLELLWYLDVKQKHEKNIHKIFAKENIIGEWFEPSARILRFLMETITHCFDGCSFGSTFLLGKLEGYR